MKTYHVEKEEENHFDGNISLSFFSIKRNDFTKCIVKNCVLPLQLVEMCPYLFSISQWSRNKSICAAGSWPTVWKNEKITLNDFFFVKSSL